MDIIMFNDHWFHLLITHREISAGKMNQKDHIDFKEKIILFLRLLLPSYVNGHSYSDLVMRLID